MTASALHSQDTTKRSRFVWINRDDALQKLSQADSMKVYKRLFEQKKIDLDTVTARITILQNLISSLKSRDSLNVSLIRTYENEIKEYKDIRADMQHEISYWQKLFLKEKRKRVWTTIGGVVAIIATIFALK